MWETSLCNPDVKVPASAGASFIYRSSPQRRGFSFTLVTVMNTHKPHTHTHAKPTPMTHHKSWSHPQSLTVLCTDIHSFSSCINLKKLFRLQKLQQPLRQVAEVLAHLMAHIYPTVHSQTRPAGRHRDASDPEQSDHRRAVGLDVAAGAAGAAGAARGGKQQLEPRFSPPASA